MAECDLWELGGTEKPGEVWEQATHGGLCLLSSAAQMEIMVSPCQNFRQ